VAGGAPSIGLSLGAPVSISNYIGNVGDGTNWKERLSSSLKQFATPIGMVEHYPLRSGSANEEVCYGDSKAHAMKCSHNNGTFLKVPQVIAIGSAALDTLAIASGACATTVTGIATGTTTSSVVHWSLATDPNGVTGYAGGATGEVLQIYAFTTANSVNFRVCNNTSHSITPGAMSVNWDVIE
jgi:hypothetical protein